MKFSIISTFILIGSTAAIKQAPRRRHLRKSPGHKLRALQTDMSMSSEDVSSGDSGDSSAD